MTSRATRLLAPALLAAALALSAQAAEIANPTWAVRPPPGLVLAVRPEGEGAGKAVLGCSVLADGSLRFCAVRSETPEGRGFAAAALKLAPFYRLAMSAPDILQAATDGGLIVPVSIEWLSAAALPHWVARPTSNDVNNAYPLRALRLGQAGGAVMSCTAASSGKLEKCAITDEYPKDQGFGAAALSLARKFRLAPKTPEGASVGGAIITVPVIFSVN